MKYVKLFEEIKKSLMYEPKPGADFDYGSEPKFSSEYQTAFNKSVRVRNQQQYDFMIEYLLDKGYTPQFGTIDNVRSKRINWDRDCIRFRWKIQWTRYGKKDGERIEIKPYEDKNSRTFHVEDTHSVSMAKSSMRDRDEDEFEDRFQLTHEYRGHKLKKFGV